ATAASAARERGADGEELRAAQRAKDGACLPLRLLRALEIDRDGHGPRGGDDPSRELPLTSSPETLPGTVSYGRFLACSRPPSSVMAFIRPPACSSFALLHARSIFGQISCSSSLMCFSRAVWRRLTVSSQSRSSGDPRSMVAISASASWTSRACSSGQDLSTGSSVSLETGT